MINNIVVAWGAWPNPYHNHMMSIKVNKKVNKWSKTLIEATIIIVHIFQVK